MAGVVGKKTPRYCLFGKHVTIANKMESGSSPGKVNVSVETKKYVGIVRLFDFTRTNYSCFKANEIM